MGTRITWRLGGCRREAAGEGSESRLALCCLAGQVDASWEERALLLDARPWRNVKVQHALAA
jgi:hypothetical protein